MKYLMMSLMLLSGVAFHTNTAQAKPNKTCSIGPCDDGTSCTASGTNYAKCECKPSFIPVGNSGHDGPTFASCSGGKIVPIDTGTGPIGAAADVGFRIVPRIQHGDAVFQVTDKIPTE